MIRPEWERRKPIVNSNHPVIPASPSKNIHWFTHFQILLHIWKETKLLTFFCLIEQIENKSYSYYGFEVWTLKRWDSENRIRIFPVPLDVFGHWWIDLVWRKIWFELHSWIKIKHKELENVCFTQLFRISVKLNNITIIPLDSNRFGHQLDS